MGKIERYIHHMTMVFVDEDLKGKHGEHCLCSRCGKFLPNSPDNCNLAEQNYRTCKINGMVMPVYECPRFVEKEYDFFRDGVGKIYNISADPADSHPADS